MKPIHERPVVFWSMLATAFIAKITLEGIVVINSIVTLIGV